MMPALDAIAAWLLAVSWQLLPLTAIVIILDFALRRAGPVVRSALWWMVLAKLIMPPGLASPVSIAQLWPVDGVSAITDSTAAPEARSNSAGLDLSAKSNSFANLTGLFEAVQSLFKQSNRASGAAMLLAIWGTGVIAAAFLVCWRYRRVRAACLEGAVLLTEAAPNVYETVAVTAARQLNLSKVPQIFVAAPGAQHAGLSAVIGFLRPCIVLPRPLLERPRGEIGHVLLHELAHVRRGDPLTSLVCLIAQIVFWFHPAVWCARRRLATLREMACDRTVARVLGEATSAYRRTLILLARGQFIAGPGALGLFQRQSEIVTRLDAQARPVSMRRATECAASAAIAAAILVSCVPLAPAPAPAQPKVSIDVPPLDQLPGSLQKRYAVMRAMALAEQTQSQPPSR
jgi:beta-lactamase regulating signal transducer with metallopeptidase domain